MFLKIAYFSEILFIFGVCNVPQKNDAEIIQSINWNQEGEECINIARTNQQDIGANFMNLSVTLFFNYCFC